MKGVADAVERDEHLTLPTLKLSHLGYILCSLVFTIVKNNFATASGKHRAYSVPISASRL
jgi:hypothetical protein